MDHYGGARFFGIILLVRRRCPLLQCGQRVMSTPVRCSMISGSDRFGSRLGGGTFRASRIAGSDFLRLYAESQP